jgi:glycine dehydrogenase subunit 2
MHEAGAYFYCDGANFNAIVGKVRPGDLGVDAMHINLHKTFSTPHGGGGPGAGPVVLSEALAPFAAGYPLGGVGRQRLPLVEDARSSEAHEQPFGRMCAFHGQMGMFVRALAYMLSHGSDGLRRVAEDAVLNANYIRPRLQDLMSPPFGNRGPCMHEALFDDDWLKGTGVTTLDFAKAMIDEGYPPDDHVFPAGRPRCHADRADRDGVQGQVDRPGRIEHRGGIGSGDRIGCGAAPRQACDTRSPRRDEAPFAAAQGKARRQSRGIGRLAAQA